MGVVRLSVVQELEELEELAVHARDPGPVPTSLDAGPACAGMSLHRFFDETAPAIARAKRICASCTVREYCLAEALDHREAYGVFGGTTPVERRAIRRARDAADGAAAAA